MEKLIRSEADKIAEINLLKGRVAQFTTDNDVLKAANSNQTETIAQAERDIRDLKSRLAQSQQSRNDEKLELDGKVIPRNS